MSFSVDQALVDAFTSSVHHTIQQSKARFDGTCRAEYGVVGESYRFELLGSAEMKAKVRHGDTQYGNRAHTNTLAVLKPFEDAELIDKMDKVRTLLNLQNDYADSIMKAYNRRKDQSFLEECIFPTTTTAIAGTTNGGLDFDTVRACNSYAQNYEWDEADRFFAYTAESMETLLEETVVGSSDYNTVKALINGDFDESLIWMGFKWRRMPSRVLLLNGKQTGAFGSVTAQTNYFYHKSGVGMAFAAEMGELSNVRVDELPTKSYSVQVYGDTMFGGQVIENALVVPVTLTWA